MGATGEVALIPRFRPGCLIFALTSPQVVKALRTISKE
jgi:hypothetical protein